MHGEMTFNVTLERPNTSSGLEIQVRALSYADARKKAQDELPQWKIVAIKVP